MEDNSRETDKLPQKTKALNQHCLAGDAVTSGKAQATTSLPNREAFFRSLIENSLDIISILDENGIFIYQSPNVEPMLGYKSEDLIGQNAFGYVNSDDIAAVKDVFDSIVKNPGEVRSVEYRFRSKDGAWRYFESVGKMLADGTGQPCVVINSRDLTDRKLAEQALMQSERRLRKAEEVARIGNWEFVVDENIFRASDGAAIIYGLEGREWEKSRVREIPLPGYRLMLENSLRNLIDRGVPYNVEFKIRRPKDGRIRDILSIANYDSQKRVIFGVIQDITDRKRAEEALKLSEQRLKLAMSSGQMGVWDWDITADALTWDDRMYELYGTSKDSFANAVKAWRNALHPDDRDKAVAAVEAVIRGEGDLDTEFRIVRPDGTVKYVKANGTVIRDTSGNPLRMIGLNRDITEIKRAEEEKAKLEQQLRQAQKMEAVGQLAGGIAHDFNNILSAIIGYGYLLQTKMQPADPLRVEVEQILESANRAAEVTHNLLAFSRKQMMNVRPVSITDILKRIEKLLARLIGEDIELSIATEDKEITCMADPGQIEQVLMNLATNARDAMPNGGKLILRAGLTELGEGFIQSHGYGERKEYAVISVSDTGVGINQGDMGKIFEPFFTTKETGKGTGLGLAMVYGIIKQHDGYITVDSEPDKGTTFRIYLRTIHTAEEVAAQDTIEPLPAGGGETILLAEDDEKLRKLFQIILSQKDYKVMIAGDGEEAVDMFIRNMENIRLVVMDMIMPKKNGVEAYHEIKKVNPGVKVLFISGYTEDKINREILDDGNVGLMFKPVSPKKILGKVKEMLAAG